MEYKYPEAQRIGHPTAQIIIRTDELKPVKDAFLSNWERVAGLASFPIFVATISSDWNQCCTFAKHELTGNFNPPRKQAIQLGEQIMERAKTIFRKMDQTDTKKIERVVHTEESFEAFIAIGGQACGDGARDVFNSMIIQAWTAFEVLSGDLWEASLNAHPHRLSDLTGKGSKWSKKNQEADDVPDPDASLEKNDQIDVSRKHLRIHHLTRFNYDMSGHMGTALRDKYSFTTLEAIRLAYGDAFSKRNERVKKAITDGCFDYLAAVRNVLVHKAGKTDEDFIRTITGCGLFSGLAMNDPVTLDGVMVKQLLAPVFAQSLELIAAVDNWIFTSKQKRANPDESAGTDSSSQKTE